MNWTIALGVSTGLFAFLFGVAVVRALFRVDDSMEKLRKQCVDAIPRLAAGGHTILVDMCKDAAVEDLTGLVGEMEKGFKTITTAEKAGPYFANVLFKEIEVQVTPSNREQALAVQKKVNELINGFPKLPA